MQGLSDMLSGHTLIGIKRMGELDEKAFQIACKRKFAKGDADIKAAVFCSKWQEHLKNPNWHPFRVITDGEKSEVRKIRSEVGCFYYPLFCIHLYVHFNALQLKQESELLGM